MSAANAIAVCYDLPAISRFFRTVARSVVVQQKTSMEWVTYKDSAVLNGIYKVLFWKEPPGYVEVKGADPSVVENEVNRRHVEFLLAWLEKLCAKGPAEADQYVRRMQQVKDEALGAIGALYREAGSINAEVVGETQRAIENLARIRLAASVGVAVIGGAVGVAFAAAGAGGASAAGGISLFGVEAGASAGTFGVVGFGDSLIKSVVKNWESAPTATVAAINLDTGKDTAKYIASEAGGRGAEHALREAVRNSSQAEQIIRSAEGLIRQHSARLAQQTMRRAAVRKSQNIVARSSAQAAEQTARLATAGRAMRLASAAAKAVPVVFAAWDVLDAWSDYQEMVNPDRAGVAAR